MSADRKVLRRMKKVMGVIGASVVLVPCSSQVSCAESKKWVCNKIRNVVEYILDDNGVLTISCISGGGKITLDWKYQSGFDKNKILNINIKNGIKSIGCNAFSYCNRIKSIRIPESVNYIRSQAFLYSSLETIEIPNSISSIGSEAFAQCYILKKFTVYDASFGVTDLDKDTGLGSVNRINISRNMFAGCTNLKELCFNNCDVLFNPGAFHGCSKNLVNFEGRTIRNLKHCSSSNPIDSNSPISIGNHDSFNDGVNDSLIGKKHKK